MMTWRLRTAGPSIDVWIPIKFDEAVTAELTYLEAKIDIFNGIIIFKSVEDITHFRIVTGS